MELNARIRQFLDQAARPLELTGLNRTGGRMFGLLLLAEGPLSLDEIAETLGVSKPMVSTSARFYERLGVFDRTRRHGDRKHYYEIRPDAFMRDATTWTEMMHAFTVLAETGLDIVDEDNEVARARLHEMRAFYSHLAAAVERALEEWNERGDTDGES